MISRLERIFQILSIVGASYIGTRLIDWIVRGALK
jgi:hypothetical protein